MTEQMDPELLAAIEAEKQARREAAQQRWRCVTPTLTTILSRRAGVSRGCETALEVRDGDVMNDLLD